MTFYLVGLVGQYQNRPENAKTDQKTDQSDHKKLKPAKGLQKKDNSFTQEIPELAKIDVDVKIC